MQSPNKSILITGCSSGIGYDAAHRMKSEGWRVLATCRKPEDVERLKSEGFESFVLDYSDEASVSAGAAQALSLTDGTLNALFNNGAFASPGAVEDLPRQAMREIFETNVFGQFQLINELLPAMRANGGGRIVNNSSILGLIALEFRGAYTSTKFAMEALTDTLRIENHGSNLHFVLIEPGPVTSLIRENSIKHFEQWIDWENSAHKQRYIDRWKPRLYDGTGAPDKWELPASAVSDKLVAALTAKKPAPRYFVTKPTYIMNILRRVLPTRALDQVLLRT